ncbi:hypothetical protein E2C01_060630 [Portunus trituberculatus]|uniref:Secreted protein n=1 Tax=Portunus trituberculatus TaxID=210409 RepID=A0A5B7H609_PORTR|nr:hypothetical protein [Portunus trituberculatus]
MLSQRYLNILVWAATTLTGSARACACTLPEAPALPSLTSPRQPRDGAKGHSGPHPVAGEAGHLVLRAGFTR